MQIVKLAVKRNSEQTMVNQIFQNNNRLNDRTIHSLFLSSPLAKDEKITDNTTVKSNSHDINSALAAKQKKQVQIDNKDNRVYEQPIS